MGNLAMQINWVLTRAKVLATLINNVPSLEAGVKSQVLFIIESNGRCEITPCFSMGTKTEKCKGLYLWIQ